MAGDSFRVDSSEVKALGRRLKAAGDGTLRKEVLAGIRKTVKDNLIPAVRQGAEDRLPRRGGLAAEVAGQKFAARTSLAAGKVSLVGANGMKSLEDIDAGKVRHPVYGDRKKWVQQSVTPGFFTNPIESRLPLVRGEIESVIRDAAKRIERTL